MATDKKAVYTKLKGQSNYQTWQLNMEAACGGENALKILYEELACPPKLIISEDLTK